MTPEQKELAIWGGGAGILIIVGAVWLSMRGGTVDDHKQRIDQMHGTYNTLYLDSSGQRQPAPAVIAELEQRLDTQKQELARIEQRTIWNGQGVDQAPPEFNDVALGASAYGTVISDYASTLDLVSRITSRLRQRSESLGVDMPAALPLEGSGAISSDNLSLRQLQLVQVCTYASLVEMAMDASITDIGPIEIGGASWGSADGNYAAVPVSTVLRCSYESADALIRELKNNTFGLGLDKVALDYDDDGTFRMAITVRMLVYALDEWNLGERGSLVAGPRGAGETGSTTRRRGAR